MADISNSSGQDNIYFSTIQGLEIPIKKVTDSFIERVEQSKYFFYGNNPFDKPVSPNIKKVGDKYLHTFWVNFIGCGRDMPVGHVLDIEPLPENSFRFIKMAFKSYGVLRPYSCYAEVNGRRVNLYRRTLSNMEPTLLATAEINDEQVAERIKAMLLEDKYNQINTYDND